MVRKYILYLTEKQKGGKMLIDTIKSQVNQELGQLKTLFLSELNANFPENGAQDEVIEICDIDVTLYKIDVYNSIMREIEKRKSEITGRDEISNKAELESLLQIGGNLNIFEDAIDLFCASD
jgi:hypothetical protein